jgi:molecular chaperone DnaJ
VNIDFDPSKDYYEALGVAATATSDEIKRAYRKLAKQCHPDSTGGDKAKEARFKEISVAYDVLGTAKTRSQYDAFRAGGGGPRGNPFASAGAGMGGMPNMGNMAGFDLGELFAHFGQRSSGGPGLRVEPFNDFGGDFGRDFGGDLPRRRTETSDADFESTVRASDGSWLKVSGVDVSSEVRVPFDRAILGTVATVATIDGKAEVKIPPGSSSGKRLRLRGKGRSENGRQGDHYITIHIDVPSDLDDDARKLLVQLVTRLRKRGREG